MAYKRKRKSSKPRLNKGLRKYMTSPKYAAKRRAAAKKAAKTQRAKFFAFFDKTYGRGAAAKRAARTRLRNKRHGWRK